MREVDDTLIQRASILLVDSQEACEEEAGELIHAGVEMKEIGQWIIQEVNQAKAESGVTIFKSVGIGLQDVAIASLVFKRADELGDAGTQINNYDSM